MGSCQCKTITAIFNGRMEQKCTAHTSEVRGVDAQSLPGRHPSEWRSYQVLSLMNLFCDD